MRFRIYLKDKYKSGYILIFKPTIKDTDGKVKGNIDTELVLWAVRIEYDNYDKAVIVSGDGDFYCLIKFLHEQKKLQNVIIPNYKKYSKLLLPFKEYLRFTNDLQHKLKQR